MRRHARLRAGTEVFRFEIQVVLHKAVGGLSSNMKIRRATLEDIWGIQQVAHEAWHVTYEHSMRPDTRANYLAEFYSEESLARSLVRDDVVLLVVEKQDEIIGFVQALPCVTDYEISRIYILPQYQGQGIGTQLLARLAVALPERHLWVIVEKHNRVALNFFQGQGFTVTRQLDLPIYGETVSFVELKR